MKRIVRLVLAGLFVAVFSATGLALVAINIGLFLASPLGYSITAVIVVALAFGGAALVLWAFDL